MRRALVVAVALAVAACGPGVPPPSPTLPAATPWATPTPVASVSAAVETMARQACATAQFSTCITDVETAATYFGGELVVVCDYGDGTGDVIMITSESEAASTCLDWTPPGRVVTTLQMP